MLKLVGKIYGETGKVYLPPQIYIYKGKIAPFWGETW